MNSTIKKNNDNSRLQADTVIYFKRRKNKYNVMKEKDIERYKRLFNNYLTRQS